MIIQDWIYKMKISVYNRDINDKDFDSEGEQDWPGSIRYSSMLDNYIVPSKVQKQKE